MNYKKILRQKAERNFEEFIDFIIDDKNLLYTINNLEDEIEVIIIRFDKDERTDILGTYYFDEITGIFIREV